MRKLIPYLVGAACGIVFMMTVHLYTCSEVCEHGEVWASEPIHVQLGDDSMWTFSTVELEPSTHLLPILDPEPVLTWCDCGCCIKVENNDPLSGS